MENFNLKIPIAFIVFNRLDTTKIVFDVIKKMKPPKLYLIADAPRNGNDKDVKKVEEVRQYIEKNIDWKCEVFKNYAKTNLGCQQRIVTGLDWVFDKEEMAIILEDDVVPLPFFFQFCQELLIKYMDNPSVMMISGTNLIKNNFMKESYTFSCFSSIWGWATWRRAWDKMDIDMKDWPSDQKKGVIKYVANPLSNMWIYWNLEYCYRKEIDTWDFPWDYARFKNRGLGIVPKGNLVKNIGMNHEDAVHTHGEIQEEFEYEIVEMPLVHPENIERDVDYDKLYIKKYFNPWKAWIEWNKKAIKYVFRKTKKGKK